MITMIYNTHLLYLQKQAGIDGDAEYATQSQSETAPTPKFDDNSIPPIPKPAGPSLLESSKIDKVRRSNLLFS